MLQSRRGKKVREEIQKQIVANPKSIQLLKNAYDQTGKLHHPLFTSFKEKVLAELKAKNEFHDIKEQDIESYIEYEVKDYVRNQNNFINSIDEQSSSDAITAQPRGTDHSGNKHPSRNAESAKAGSEDEAAGTNARAVGLSRSARATTKLRKSHDKASKDSSDNGNKSSSRKSGKKGALRKAKMPTPMKGKGIKTYMKRYPAVILLLLAILFVQIITYVKGAGANDPETALQFGAFQAANTAPAEWYRFATYLFVQMGGTLTLLVNLVAIGILAPGLERMYGAKKFTTLFFLTGIISGIAVSLTSVAGIWGGAAGSICGFIGLYAGLALKRKKEIRVKRKMLIFIGSIAFLFFLFVSPSFPSNAYYWGLASGFVLSLFVQPQEQKRLAKKNWPLAAFQTILVAVIILFVLALPKYMPDTVNRANAEKLYIHLKDAVAKVANKESTTQQEEETQTKPEQRPDNISNENTDSEYPGAKTIDYKELQKNPENYIGTTIHFHGEIYNIQEIDGKTILSLSTKQDGQNYLGDEALVLYSGTTPLQEGDDIDVYGEMLGNYESNKEKLNEFVNNNKYSIYFDQRTFINQAPVLLTKRLVDANGNVYGE
ncbi:rhomboid family intramembrane serine protease [Caldibacillus lycopersici]|uniref:Rhomboid family intramembrane serine protease n=1 Tax=Perspicuibacillus lycopersici TaxID=1325689 RepID=A0AAE3IW77_9BACI|nr:rhomboid family intramembrane serine protease [Perspicuibacillus lycopersici]MCU9613215.1 rhomboid family intramembrane serine protease [Perspicuibacillus lycopersici]